MVKDTLRADEEDEDDDSCGVSKELTFEPGQALTVELMYQTFTADINAGLKECKCQILPSGADQINLRMWAEAKLTKSSADLTPWDF